MAHVVICGDALAELRKMPDESVQCCVTSPPYWGLRNYGTAPQVWGGCSGCGHEWADASWKFPRWGAHDDDKIKAGRQVRNAGSLGHRGRVRVQWVCTHCGAWRGSLGLEPTFQMYVEHLVELFREVRRVLDRSGTLWLVLGDSYASSSTYNTTNTLHTEHGWKQDAAVRPNIRAAQIGLKPKNLCGIPWRVAFALQADGWWLRQDVIWSKPNAMPESVLDRCTKAHEYVFLLSRRQRYYYDAAAIAEPCASGPPGNRAHRGASAYHAGLDEHQRTKGGLVAFAEKARASGWATRNRRSVWAINTKAYKEAHFATFPPELPRLCILAGSRPGDAILDPFAGAGTTGLAAAGLGRDSILIELNPDYCGLIRRRLSSAS